jgi:hypothetical protein
MSDPGSTGTSGPCGIGRRWSNTGSSSIAVFLEADLRRSRLTLILALGRATAPK